MDSRSRTFLKRNKYKLAVFGLMAVASIMCVLMLAARMSYSDSGRYTGLVWNLFLAWIPFVLSYTAYVLSWRRYLLYLLIPVTVFLWLLFFPNALYILTDLQHLGQGRANVPVWYDVVVLIWFSWTGLLLGIVSLFLMQEIVRREFGRWVGWAFVASVAALSSTGVYMGRFLRWNSWDIFFHPAGMAAYTLQRAQDPSLQSLVFTSLFGAFFLFLYVTLYTFGHLLLERQVGETVSR